MRSIILCVVLLLAARETPAPSHVEMAPAVKLETRALYWGDSWSYEGEVRPGVRAMRGRTPLNPWAPICNDGYCAHGYGDLGTDGSWGYKGTFVDGLMHGHGTYWNDYYDYVGSFERDDFDGLGVLTCLDGYKFEGIFDDGKMTGQFNVTTPDGDERTELFSSKHVDYVGPCDPNF